MCLNWSYAYNDSDMKENKAITMSVLITAIIIYVFIWTINSAIEQAF